MFQTVKQLCPDPSLLGLTTDIRGWNGRHPVFAQVVEQYQPHAIVEVGCWYGHGTLHLAEISKGDLYCVDTWLGGYDHLILRDRADCQIPTRFGYPSLYNQWLFNVAVSPYADRILPIPQTSVNGARLLARAGKNFSMIVIDASHEYSDVFADLCEYDKILMPFGVMVVDDFRSHAGVFHAVVRFAHERGFDIRENGPFAIINRRGET